jgi:hypothetical protein
MASIFKLAASSLVLIASGWSCATVTAATTEDPAPALTAYTVPVAPWTYPDHPDQGVAPEYLSYLFHEAGIPLKVASLPYLRAINGLRDGSNTAALLIPDTERDQFALRLCTVTTIRSGILYKKARYPSLDAQHLHGMTIGVPLGTHALDNLKEDSGVTMHHIESITQGVKMLQVDHLDATYLSSPGSNLVMEQENLAASDYGWLEIETSPVVVYLSRQSPLASAPAALAHLKSVCEGKARPVMDALMQKYH